MARKYIQTIGDLEKAYYDVDRDITAEIKKSDSPIKSGTTGVHNAIYGAETWALLNQESNAFGVLPKYPWDQSGWRIITARAQSTPSGGVAENASLPDTNKPTFQEVSTNPKTVAHTFNNSEVQEYLAMESEDDSIGDMAYMRQLMANEHKEHINAYLLQDVDTTAGNGFESIDRVCSNNSEATDGSISLDSGDADMYGSALDRDSASTWDAYVNHNSGTNRSLSDSLIRNTLTGVEENGGNPGFWLTGHDTMSGIRGLYEDQVRYNNPIGEASIQPSVNGIETDEGTEVGINVSTLYGKPLIKSKDVKKDGIGRMYLLDTSDPEGFGIPRLGIKVAKPTQYFESGMSTGDPFGIDKLGNEGMYRTMGELIVTAPHAQGKIRDLKA